MSGELSHRSTRKKTNSLFQTKTNVLKKEKQILIIQIIRTFCSMGFIFVFTPLRILNAQRLPTFALINRRQVGVLNVQRCKRDLERNFSKGFSSRIFFGTLHTKLIYKLSELFVPWFLSLFFKGTLKESF